MLLARVLFLSQDEVESKDVSEPLVSPKNCLPSHIPYVVSYLGTLTHRLALPIH